MNKKICYIGNFDFSRENASTLRVKNIALSLTQDTNDYDVCFIGYGFEKRLKKDGFEIYNTKRGRNFISKIYYTLFRGFYAIKILKTLPDVSHIIYYGSSSLFLLPLIKYARRYKKKIVTDIVEWYDYSHLPLGRYSLSALDVEYAMTKLIFKCDGVIVISSYLEKYCQSKAAKLTKIPVIIDTQPKDLTLNTNADEISKLFDRKTLNLIYAGFAGKKDLILNAICAVEQLYAENIPVNIHILGTTKEDIQTVSNHTVNENCVKCYGKINQKNVPAYLKNADFSVLLRPNARYANAGFPTKFVESLNIGLPVIANVTSDIGLYLKSGYNGFVLENCSVEELKKELRILAFCNKSEFEPLRQNARTTAVEHFDYRLYTNEIKNFISAV